MYTSYSRATKGNHEKGYRDCVVAEHWKSRRDYWREKLAQRWLIYQFDHRGIELGDRYWKFKQNPYQRLGDALIERLIGRPEEPARDYYYAEEVRSTLLEEDP